MKSRDFFAVTLVDEIDTADIASMLACHPSVQVPAAISRHEYLNAAAIDRC
jgi:hypothetical protein